MGRREDRSSPTLEKCPQDINELVQEVSIQTEKVFKESKVGSPFCSGVLTCCPTIHHKDLPSDFPPPPEWKEADYAKVKPLLSQAPYGKGMETVIDKNVRDALEIAQDSLVIENKNEWQAQLAKAVQHSAENLVPNIGASGISAELYKLVVYEVGGHFKAHRDTQRSELHFGTLVVILPSKATGGELVLRHGEKEETFTIPGGKKKCTYISYFADVEHEVLPVTKGRRISLLYHLVRKPNVQIVQPPVNVQQKLSPLVVKLQELQKVTQQHLDKLASSDEPPQKKQKTDSEEGKGKEKDENENGESSSDESEEKDEKFIPRFIGYICEHAYAGSLSGDKLKGEDAHLFNVVAPHFPGTRVAHIEMRLYGPAHGDDAKWVRSIDDLSSTIVEIDEVGTKETKDKDAEKEPKRSRFWGGLSFSKSNNPSRALYAATYGDVSDYDLEDEASLLKVRFVNKRENMVECVTGLRAIEKRAAGSGNEGAAGAFLYKRVAILIPIVPGAEHSLGEFSIEHASREHPDFLP